MVSLLNPAACANVYKQTFSSFTTPTPLGAHDYLVLGFLGGMESWDAADQGVRKLALELRAQKIPGLHVETVEHQKLALAIRLIREAFDRNRDGNLDEDERRSIRLILYGMSFGGAAVVELARQLDVLNIPVLLTVQVDSVGADDDVIPPNVAEAANIYQGEGRLVRGASRIRAKDPARTKILGNFRVTYSDRKVDLSAIPWYKIFLRRAHAKVNADPEVWATVGDIILSAISDTRSGR